MPVHINRRDFIKLAGLGAAASAVGVLSQRMTDLHRYGAINSTPNPVLMVQNGEVATTCPGCRLNCGLMVHIAGGVVQRISGNSIHPVNQGMLCSGAGKCWQSYYSSARFTGPLAQSKRGSGDYFPISWLEAEHIIAKAFSHTPASEIVFLAAAFPDHLADYFSRLISSTGNLIFLRLGGISTADYILNVQEAAQKLSGFSQLPYFDTESASLVYSFGLGASEPWLSSLSRLRMSAQTGHSIQNGPARWVHFSARKPAWNMMSARWIAVAEGNEGLLTRAMSRLILSAQSGGFVKANNPDVEVVANLTSLGYSEILSLVEKFVSSDAKLAIPGVSALREADGLSTAEAVLKINLVTHQLEKPGGMYFSPPAPVYPHSRLSIRTRADLNFLIERMKLGMVKRILIHGSDPIDDAELRDKFIDALENVPQVISFSSVPNDISLCADYILPDHHVLESWGYQKPMQGVDRAVLSAIQPVFYPAFYTRATINVLSSAVKRMQASRAFLPFHSSQPNFLRESIAKLHALENPERLVTQEEYWAEFFRRGGWWNEKPVGIPAALI